MADSKISALTALTGANVAIDDAFPIVDTSAAETKKIVAPELFAGLGASGVHESTPNATNYARIRVRYDSGTTAFQVIVDAAGTGSIRPLTIGTNGLNNLNFTTNSAVRMSVRYDGHLIWASDNTIDIGLSGANRPRNLYLGGGITHGSATLLTTTTALTNGAAAQVATLTNGPTAGNPTKWIPINDNGTTRYIPAW